MKEDKDKWDWKSLSDILKTAINHTVDTWFILNQTHMDIKAGDVAPDLFHKMSESLDSYVGNCVRALMIQYNDSSSCTVTDFTEMNWDFAEIVQSIIERFNLKTDYVFIKINKNVGGKQTEWFDMTPKTELYEWLDNTVQVEDCKNGVRLCKSNNEYYISIVGSNYYDGNNTYMGTNEVKLYFKEIV